MARISRKQADRGRDFVEDRRGASGGGSFGRRGGSAGGRPSGGAVGGGLGAILLAILAAIFGPGIVDGGGGGTTVNTPATEQASTGGGSFNVDGPGFGNGPSNVAGENDPIDCDVSVVECLGGYMADTDVVWSALFENAGRQYTSTKMVLYEGETRTDGCGIGRAAAGPFYCGAPTDQKVYIDIGAMEGLQNQLGAKGDFAQAYIIAHEVGHHIQAITGISDQVRGIQAQNPGSKNDLSVRQELQADCFAGVWAHYANQNETIADGLVIEPGDAQEAIDAAQAVGDDSIQSQAGYVDPHTFTHGTSAQRAKWFNEGFQNGNPDSCDTFSIATP